MLAPLRHPVLGMLVPDQWNVGLLAFRQFPHWKLLCPPDAATALARLDPQERAWVLGWERHAAELARVCRNVHVHYALRSLGVFEMSVAVGKDGTPTAEQAATYQAFCDQEAAICRNVCDALLRYYRHARVVLSDWFRGEEYPPGDTIEELVPLLGFDDIGLSRRASQGLCPISLGFDPAWDPEHGLQLTLWGDQVLEISAAGERLLVSSPDDYLTNEYLIWGPQQLNAAERAALDRYLAGRGG